MVIHNEDVGLILWFEVSRHPITAFVVRRKASDEKVSFSGSRTLFLSRILEVEVVRLLVQCFRDNVLR